MQLSHRKPPSKKRHTKPCKFFQTGKCSFSAEECDFAHILPNEVSSQSSRLCRYYAAGSCDNGSNCRFQHIQGQFEGGDIKVGGEKDPLKQTYTAHEHPSMHNTTAVAIDNTSPVDNLYSFSDPWHNPYVNTIVYPSYPPCPLPHLHYPEYHSPSNSTDSGSGPSLCSLSDEGGFVTEDPKYTEHYHQYQSQIRIADEPIIHVSPFYHSPPPPVPVLRLDTSYSTLSNVYGGFQQQSTSPTQSTKAHSQVRPTTRHPKIINYKTKPCKFFNTNRGCPNGSDCTFIHDEILADTLSTDGSKTSPILPAKPLSKFEENKKKNFYPITWRVIGGGVLVGDPRSGLLPEDPPDVDSIQDDVPSSEALETEYYVESPPTKPRARARSTSNPPAPNFSPVKTNMRLFSAESPGNL